MSTNAKVLGHNLAHRGRRPPAVAARTSNVADDECANILLRSSRFGHDTFTSTAMTDAGASASNSAARWNSPTVRPQMLATTRALARSSAGSWCSSHASIPGPFSPTLLIMPAAVSCTRGGGLPAQGDGDNDLTTTAPIDDRSK